MNDALFQSIFEANKDAVYGFAWRMTGTPEAAEDIAQDTFLALLRSPGRYDESRGSVRAWLLGVARNLILKRWRTEGRWMPLEDEACAAERPPDDWHMSRKVAHAVQSLPPFQREAVILVEYEGMTMEQAARTAGVEPGTIKARLHRARENLRHMLEPLRSVNHDR